MRQIKDSHIALTASAEIQEICKPLDKYLGLSNFCYHKVFPNGKEICLSNNIGWTKYVHENNITIGPNTDNEVANARIILWSSYNKIKLFRDIRSFGWCHGLGIIKGKNEIFGFAAKDETDINVFNKYINNNYKHGLDVYIMFAF